MVEDSGLARSGSDLAKALDSPDRPPSRALQKVASD